VRHVEQDASEHPNYGSHIGTHLVVDTDEWQPRWATKDVASNGKKARNTTAKNFMTFNMADASSEQFRMFCDCDTFV
jgi:hypothetical protein